MFLSVVTFYFGLLSVVTFFKTKPNCVYFFGGGRLIGVKTIGEPSLGRPKGDRGRLIEVAAK